MIATLPLADEYWLGHVGRLALRNGARRLDTMRRLLCASSTLPSQPPPPLIDLVADFIGFGPLEYAQQHSLCTFQLRRPRLVGLDVINPGVQQSVRRFAHHRSRSAAFLCKECTARDLLQRGYSYWRRQHQVPGIHFCMEHDAGLTAVEDSEAFWQLPDQLIAHGQPAEFAQREDVQQSALVKRYSLAAQALLDWPWWKQLSMFKSRVFMLVKAKGYALHVPEEPESLPRVARTVVERAPRDWLEQLYPRTIRWLNVPWYDGAAFLYQRWRSSTQGLCIVAAALTDSASELMDVLNGGAKQMAPVRESSQDYSSRAEGPLQ